MKGAPGTLALDSEAESATIVAGSERSEVVAPVGAAFVFGLVGKLVTGELVVSAVIEAPEAVLPIDT